MSNRGLSGHTVRKCSGLNIGRPEYVQMLKAVPAKMFPFTCQKCLLVPNEIANVQPMKCLPAPENEEVPASFMCGSQPTVIYKSGRPRDRPRKTRVDEQRLINIF
jgi:hypothetical protein